MPLHWHDSETLAALVNAPFLDTAERIEALYLGKCHAGPAPGNWSARAGSSTMPCAMPRTATGNATALSDVFWALLNSSEFVLNH